MYKTFKCFLRITKYKVCCEVIEMNLKKRKKSILVSVIISLSILFAFSACSNTETQKLSSSKNTPKVSEEGDLASKANKPLLDNVSSTINAGKHIDAQVPVQVPNKPANPPQIQAPANLPQIKPNENAEKPKIKKVVYLTFDDGPSANVTPQMLDTLKKYNVKATFFLIGKNTVGNEEVVKRIKSEGHVIGNHSYTHDDKRLYSDFEFFKSDFNECNQTLTNILGENGYSKIYRFPRGEYGHHKKERAFVEAQGFKVYDWNSLSYDAELPENKTPQQLLQNIKQTSRSKNNVIVLMHTSAQRQNSEDALPSIIEYFKSEGYTFDVL